MIGELNRDHIERALQRIDAEGVPPGRVSRKYCLIAKGRRYPPKYIISLASYYAHGRELRPEEFSGGIETNRLLEKLGYTIEDQYSQSPAVSRSKRNLNADSQARRKHDERCPACKDAIFQMLAKGLRPLKSPRARYGD